MLFLRYGYFDYWIKKINFVVHCDAVIAVS